VEGSPVETVLMKGVERRATTDELFHVDLFRVSMTESIRTQVPLLLVGESAAVKQYGATLLHTVDAVHVECLPGDLPAYIEVDLTRLAAIDDTLYVRDLVALQGVAISDDPDEVLVKALGPTVPEAEEAEEATGAGATAVPAPAPGTETAEDAVSS
jgi:large subunit ribosomal protein L25